MNGQAEFFTLRQLGLPEDIWEPLAHGSLRHTYLPGEIIYLQETPAEQFYYITEGRVKTFISDPDGKEKLLTIYRSGNILGEAAFFDRLPRVSSAVALCECKVVIIDQETFSREIEKHPDLALAMMKYLARTVRVLSGQVDGMVFLRADQRLARHLLELGHTTPFLECTQEELAAAVGVSRVTVNRILNRFARDGMISIHYGTLRLLDPEGLSAYC